MRVIPLRAPPDECGQLYVAVRSRPPPTVPGANAAGPFVIPSKPDRCRSARRRPRRVKDDQRRPKKFWGEPI